MATESCKNCKIAIDKVRSKAEHRGVFYCGSSGDQVTVACSVLRQRLDRIAQLEEAKNVGDEALATVLCIDGEE